MGVLSIILGLALLGVLADVVVENDLTSTAHDPLTIVGTTQSIAPPVIAIVAFAAGAFAVVLIVLGFRRLRHAGRKHLEERIRVLQDENARLHTQRNLEKLVRIPEAEPVESKPTDVVRVEEAAPSNEDAAEHRPDQPASRW